MPGSGSKLIITCTFAMFHILVIPCDGRVPGAIVAEAILKVPYCLPGHGSGLQVSVSSNPGFMWHGLPAFHGGSIVLNLLL